VSKHEILYIAIGVAVVVVLVALALGLTASRRRETGLKRRFGSEYDRTVDDHGDRTAAEKELRGRMERRRELKIKALSPEAQGRYQLAWQKVQSDFVDEPSQAVRDADALVTRVMTDRGYPMTDFEQRAADVSVDHGDVVADYRGAHAISLRNEQGVASTEELRQAMTHYRALFLRLLDDGKPEVPIAARYAGTAAPSDPH